MTKEELKKAMENDEDIAPAPSKIDERRRKYHERLGKHGEKELERVGNIMSGAMNLLQKHGLKENEIFEALVEVAKIHGNPIPDKIMTKLKGLLSKKSPYQSAMEKASKRLDEPGEKFDPYKKKEKKK